ncbi:MAG: sugar porter family MFS transporter [Bacteroidales bacterium]|jgi:sugar porter (SP) family MFS transporter
MNSGKQNKVLVIIIAVIASTGGLLFGFDTGVISGAIPFLQDHFSLNDSQIENITAFGLLGAVLGALMGGRIADILGRKKIIFVAAIVFATGALWSGFAPNPTQLLFSRLYIGIAIGVASFAVPLYIAEVSPTKMRGALVSLFQFMITIGILASYLSDSALANNDKTECWRTMFYVGVIPALILFIGAFFLPETPRWLMKKGREQESKNILSKIEEPGQVDHIFQTMKDDIKKEPKRQSWNVLFRPWLKNAFIIAVGIMFFQQFVGINTVIYYSPKIFLKAGFEGNEAAIWASVSIGVVNVLFTIVSMFLIDRLGRRKLYFIGLTGIILSLISIGFCFYFKEIYNIDSKWLLVISMLIYVGFFTLSIGPLGWLLISEVYPLSVRGVGSSIGSLSNWGFNALVVWSFFKLSRMLGDAEVFWLFALIGILGVVWGIRYIPETKGVSLEDIEEHWRSGEPPNKLKVKT